MVVGPEAPLAAGLGDELRAAGLAVFGPGREGARLEGSKIWAKELMRRLNIPRQILLCLTLRQREKLPENLGGKPVVVKADGYR